MTTLIKIIIAFCLSITCYSCNHLFNGIKGKGEVIKKEILINKEYTSVKVSDGLEVELRKSTDKKISIEANANLHEHIKVYVKGSVLYIESDKNIYKADKKTIYVPFTKINKIVANSGSSIDAEETIVQKNIEVSANSGADIDLDIKAENITTAANSGASLEIEGRVNNHTARANSGAKINTEKLISLISKADASSGASIKIHALNEINANASSGASINFYGEPKMVSKNDNSGGSVQSNR